MQRQDYRVSHGEDWLFRLEAHEADGVTPLPITGGEIHIRIKGPAGLLIEAGPLDGTAVVDGEAGLGNIVVTSAKTATVPADVTRLTYTTRVILAGGAISDQAFGEITVRHGEFSA